MKQKELYTFEELCEGLEMTMSAFCKRANVDEGTVARIRKGYSARNSTVNKLLRNFSEVYGIPLSRENVLPWAERQPATCEQVTVQPVEIKPISEIPQKEKPQISTVEPKRGYTRRKDTGLPEGCILATEFGIAHGMRRETFRDHMNNGLGPGLIHGPNVPEDGTVLVRDYVHFEERNKRVRRDGTVEKERYLTPSQQTDALQFWKRHGVRFDQCDRTDCPCHQ